MHNRRRVVVTGMGVVTALGETVDGYWDRLLAGDSGISPISRFSTEGFAVHFGGECADFDPLRHIDRKQVRRIDRFAHLAIAACDEATADCGADFEQLNPDRSGVIIGSGIGGLIELEQQFHRLSTKGPDKLSAFTIPKLMVNAASGNISIRHHAMGPNAAVATACASANNAMGDALHAIRRGDAEIVITGGAEAALTPLGLGAFAAMKALSERNDSPETASRPFDRTRDGFVLAEGAGILVFEEYEHARQRGAQIHAEILGVGSSGDAGHITQPAPDGAGAVKAMRWALQDAGLAPEELDYINAHGTATILGDLAETLAIKEVFGDHARTLSISSTKSSIGHLLGASGGVEIIATIMALKHNVIPPTINLHEPDPECDLDYVPNTPRDMHVRAAMTNSFGFGGHNATLVVGRA